MTNTGQSVREGFEQRGAVSLPLACWPHAHLFQQEVVLRSLALQVSKRESHQSTI